MDKALAEQIMERILKFLKADDLLAVSYTHLTLPTTERV